MKYEPKYSSSLTGEPFLFYEIRQVSKIKLEGITEDELREAVKTQNVFQYKTEKSVNKRLKAVIKRLAVLDDTLKRYLAEKPSDTAKIINLYSIMKSNCLMYDFVMETVAEKFSHNSLVLEKVDLNEFLTDKRQQIPEMSHWKDDTLKKLRQVLARILYESGILADPKTGQLQRNNLDSEVIEYYKSIGELHVLKAMGINI
ncbi:MAG: DUF1819 family protein [Syntrophomonadaceae bacterium]|mgnify:FL=1|jgi:3'-phosphoadenosine 5'-phosphosulfate sulfotransferase (PAPS reductase)/FAD synthetase|nr:DUF1819 family protein [Syntrophomonadaceae bacterium]